MINQTLSTVAWSKNIPPRAGLQLIQPWTIHLDPPYSATSLPFPSRACETRTRHDLPWAQDLAARGLLLVLAPSSASPFLLIEALALLAVDLVVGTSCCPALLVNHLRLKMREKLGCSRKWTEPASAWSKPSLSRGPLGTWRYCLMIGDIHKIWCLCPPFVLETFGKLANSSESDPTEPGGGVVLIKPSKVKSSARELFLTWSTKSTKITAYGTSL